MRSDILNINFEKQEDGSIIFEDGVIYNASEIDIIKRISSVNNIKEWIKAIHIIKKSSETIITSTSFYAN